MSCRHLCKLLVGVTALRSDDRAEMGGQSSKKHKGSSLVSGYKPLSRGDKKEGHKCETVSY
jgi:hypothetical protein